MLAGVTFFIKLLGDCPLNSFFKLIKHLLIGYKKEHSFTDDRCPISPNLLLRLCVVCYKCCFSDFEATLCAFAFSLMFFGALRIGLLLPRGKQDMSGLHFKHFLTFHCSFENRPIWKGYLAQDYELAKFFFVPGILL